MMYMFKNLSSQTGSRIWPKHPKTPPEGWLGGWDVLTKYNIDGSDGMIKKINNIYLFMISRWVRTKRRPESLEATFPMVMDVLESTGSILEVVETLAVNITIASTLTSTILVTLERFEWKISLMDFFFQNGVQQKLRLQQLVFSH